MPTAPALLTRRWLLIPLWLAANVLGFGLVGAGFHNFPLAFSFPPSLIGLSQFQFGPGLLGGLMFGFTPALLVGLAQWALLRPLLAPSRWWILTVPAGMAWQHFLNDGLPNARDLGWAVLLSAGLTGLLQMRLLRSRPAFSRWWLAASSGGWLLGWIVSIALLNNLGLLQRAWVRGLDGQQHGLQGLVVGAAFGLLTSLVLLQASPATARPSTATKAASSSPATKEVSA